MRMITIFTTATCPKCKILKKKMDEKDIAYEECADEERLQQMGILSVPVLSVDGQLMDFMEAIQFVNER